MNNKKADLERWAREHNMDIYQAVEDPGWQSHSKKKKISSKSLQTKRKYKTNKPKGVVKTKKPETNASHFILDTNAIVDSIKSKAVINNVAKMLKGKRKVAICDVVLNESCSKQFSMETKNKKQSKQYIINKLENFYGKNRIQMFETFDLKKPAKQLENKYEPLHYPDSILLALAIREHYAVITNDVILAECCKSEKVFTYDQRESQLIGMLKDPVQRLPKKITSVDSERKIPIQEILEGDSADKT